MGLFVFGLSCGESMMLVMHVIVSGVREDWDRGGVRWDGCPRMRWTDGGWMEGRMA